MTVAQMYNIDTMSQAQLMRRVMSLEVKLQEFLATDKYIGKTSRVAKIMDECNAIWKALEASERKGGATVLPFDDSGL